MQQKIVFTLFALLFCALGFAQDSASFSGYNNGVLELQSSMPAGVWFNEQAVGSTPFLMEVPAGWAVYSLRAPGHWTETYLANFNKGVKVSHSVQMKKFGIPAIEIPDISQINDLRTLESIYDSLVNPENELIPDSLCIAYFVADFPLPFSAPEPLDDNSAEYRRGWPLEKCGELASAAAAEVVQVMGPIISDESYDKLLKIRDKISSSLK
ncbi:hypothetical protein R83H12_01979 [Fibrobacteria bacterium R8-3-H12]